MRIDRRENHQLRNLQIVPDYIKNVPASALIEMGDTRVLCTGLYEEKTPFFLKGSNKGWIKAEYSMLPGSTGKDRVNRERMKINNRHIEIQRFVGRALRTVIDLKKIAGKTVHIDADVIQADGGTRCASLNAGMVVLVKVLKYLVYETIIPDLPEIQWLASVSIGVKDNEILVDLNYKEDFEADADINIVSSENGNIVEVQAFGEEKTIPKEIFQKVIDMGVEKNLEIIRELKSNV